MKIGILKETKTIIDNRVALTPQQIISLQNIYPEVEFFVEKSDIRCYSDNEYKKLGIPLVRDMNHCDILIGVKEVNINCLLPNKHYIFYGHIAKEQPYNQPLIKKMIEQKITFTDYEYFLDDNKQQLCNFGFWAGVVGTYNTICAYGIKTHKFELEKPSLGFTFDNLKENISNIKHLCNTSIIITGNGKVSQGAQYIMQCMDSQYLSPQDFINKQKINQLNYTVLKTEDLVQHKNGLIYNTVDFKEHGENYVSNFATYAQSAEILISCHFWQQNQPVYVDDNVIKDKNRTIKVIGDITCDIRGSILSTIRSSTHDEPFYDFNPITMAEELPFSNSNNITVMSVDTCPNALAREASESFGKMLSEHILPILITEGKNNMIIKNATILDKGCLTEKYFYLKNYIK